MVNCIWVSCDTARLYVIKTQYFTMYHLVCVNCGATYPADEILYNCKKCGHLLAVKYSPRRNYRNKSDVGEATTLGMALS